MHQLGEAQHEHWSGQGVLEHLCAETHKRGASNESKTAADPFSKLLASFETQELLPTLHPSSVLSPSKRQRKSYRPSRVPPTCEVLPPMHDKRSQTAPSEGVRMDQSALIEQQPHASLQAYDTATCSDTQERKKLTPPSPTIKDLPHMAKLLQNGMNTHDLSLPTRLNPEKFITNLKSFLPTDDKLSNGIENNGSENFTYLLNLQQNDKNLDLLSSTVCRNVACQAQISLEASFCRRCSCCICKLFDDERDPSLWICCDPVANGGCGLFCHIECALKQRVAGVVTTTNGSIPSLDGSYFCQSCGAITPLIGCWKEQLSAAKDARNLDSFQYRLLLSYRLLNGTNRHRDAHGLIEEAVKKVDAEVSQLATGFLQRLRCCNENMLSCKEDVQRLINLALEKARTRSLVSGEDAKQAGHSMAPCMVCFEDVSSSSIVVTVNDVETFMKPKLLGYKLWHRRASEPMYACTPTSILYNIHDKFVVSNLHPLTDYTFKVVLFSAEGDLAVCEAGCSTKGAEHIESPLDVYASLDVVLINTQLVGEGTSRCVNQVFNYHIDKPKNGLKIQDLEEVSPDKNKQAHHVSSLSPSTRKEQKDNCECIEGINSKTGANTRHGRGENLIHSNIAAAQQGRKGHSLVASGPSKFKQACTGSGNLSMRKSPCVSLECQEDKRLVESSRCNSELKATNKQEFCYGISANGFCSSTEKASTTKVLKCDRPSQRWGMQRHGSDNTSAASTQTDMGIVRGADDHDHMQGGGAVACNGEAEFSNYEFSVKVIRWLECQGHLKEEFRMKFLTWYTLRASEHEKRVVSVFIDTLQDDPAGLGGQLVDAFEDIIETKRQPTTPDGYCRRLW